MTLVHLRVWGDTDADAEACERVARAAAHADWQIEQDAELLVGAPCPIPRHDAAALAQGRAYRQAWAFYPAPLTLERAYTSLRYALSPLGIDIGPEVRALWLDRRNAGRAPLPAGALRDLVALAEQLLAEARHTTGKPL